MMMIVICILFFICTVVVVVESFHSALSAVTRISRVTPLFDIAENKNAGNSYEITEKFIAGIVLQGSEVKTCRKGGGVILSDGIIDIRNSECWLDNVHIAEYGRSGRYYQHQPKRSRKLLLTKREILKLEQRQIQKNHFIFPLRIFFSEKNFVKVEIGVGPAKSLQDKRDDMIKKDGEREIRRVMKGGYD